MFTRLRKNRFAVMFSVVLTMTLGAISSVNALNAPDLGLFCGDYNLQARVEMARLWQGTPLEGSLPNFSPTETNATHCGACTMPHAANVVKAQPLPNGPVPVVLGHSRLPEGVVPLPSPYASFTTRAPPVVLT